MAKEKETKTTFVSGMMHGINTSQIDKCPKCGSGVEDWEVKNYNIFFNDGDIYCKCGQFIRYYDAG